MNEDINNYDQRQIVQMQQNIAAFEGHQIDLAQLISALDVLLAALENPSQKWKNDLQSYWGNLEEIYAVALDRGQDPMHGEDGITVQQTIGHLKDLLDKFA